MTVAPLTGKARRAVELSTCRLNVFEGSVRSGKTIASLLAWLLFVRQGPAGNLLMVGRTERTLKRNVIDPLVEMLGPKRCRYVAGSGELWLLGRRVYTAGANDERAQEKIRGLTLVGVYVDEVTILPESFWSMLLTRLSVDGARLFGTTNPDNPNHWLMRQYLERPAVWLTHDGRIEHHDGLDRLDLARLSFRLRDNPHLTDGYITALEAEFVGLWRKRFIEGLWVLAEGAVFDTFDPNPDAGQVAGLADGEVPIDWVVAVDYGTTNPFHALLVACTSQDRMWVAREWRWDSKTRHGQRTDAEYSTDLRSWLNGPIATELPSAQHPSKVIVDPSAASFIAQLWRDNWTGITPADNTVLDGIRTVSSLLTGGRLIIDPSCTALTSELSGYVWDDKAAARGVEQPLKQNDHGVDALRYATSRTRLWWRHWLSRDDDVDVAV